MVMTSTGVEDGVTTTTSTTHPNTSTDDTVWKGKYPFVSINGIPVPSSDDGDAMTQTRMAAISIWDTSFHRGDGVFEVMRLLPNGEIRALENHLTRLATSASAVQCPLPSRETLRNWLQQASTGVLESKNDTNASSLGSPGCLRLIATKGGGGGGPGVPSSVPPSIIISWFPLPKWPETFSLCPILAPWHCAGAPGWETPIKWTSYGPNVLSTQKAKDQGFTDAVLLSSLRLSNSWTPPSLEECHVLDGPNFALAWIRDDTLYLPDATALGLLPSITQDLIQTLARKQLGIKVEQGIYTLQDVLDAEEVYVTSTTRGIIPVTRIGSHSYPSPKNPYIPKLQTLLAQHYGE